MGSGPTLWGVLEVAASAATAIYMLVVLRELLHRYYAYDLLDRSLGMLANLTVLSALLAVGLTPFHNQAWPRYTQVAIDLFAMLYLYDITRTLLSNPIPLFGYGRKIPLASMTALVSGGIALANIALAFALAGFEPANLHYLPTLLYVPAFLAILVTVGASFYLFVVNVRMFFAAARQLERQAPYQTLTPG